MQLRGLAALDGGEEALDGVGGVGAVGEDLLERVLGPTAIVEEAVDQLVEDAYREAAREQDIVPLTTPEVEITQAEEGKPVIFKATIQVRPELVLGDFEKFAFGPEVKAVDETMVDKVLDELRDGRIEVSVMRAESGEARVRVWDDGTPIPEHVRERIFDKFVQAAAARRHERSSVGLGLTFCKLAVEAMGGKIWATSTEREGTSFTFTLPAS